MNAIKIQKPYKRFLLTCAGVIVLLLVVAQIGVDVLALRSYDRSGALNMAQLITMSVENLLQPASTDMSTNKVFFAPAHMAAPAATYPIGYTYYVDDSGKGMLSISSLLRVHAEESKVLVGASITSPLESGTTATNRVLDAVPELQACARGVQVYINTPASELPAKVIFHKTLSDGRQLTGVDDGSCAVAGLDDVAKQLVSY